ncbi:MAG: hypothetical protein AB1440_16860, partial [Pseudomonadota bacterium]
SVARPRGPRGISRNCSAVVWQCLLDQICRHATRAETVADVWNCSKKKPTFLKVGFKEDGSRGLGGLGG